MKRLRPAFTIIEILISVIILSFSIVFVFKLYGDNKEHIIYLSERNKLSLQDSLFLSENILKYHKSEKNAYEILERYFKIKESKSRKILKQSMRNIFIPKKIQIPPPPGIAIPPAIINEIKLKNNHSSSYWHLKLQ